MNILLLTAALSGWMTSLYLILILMEKKNNSNIQKLAEDNNEQLKQNLEHIEAITECIEEMNESWEEQIREYCNR